MVSFQQLVLTSLAQDRAFTVPPAELLELYKASRIYLNRSQGTIDDDTWYGLLSQHFYLSIMTSHDNDASLMLNRITDRFGETTSRVALMKSQYLEVTEGPEAAYKYLTERDENDFIAMKRRAAFSKFKGNTKEYIEKLLSITEIIPTDAEVWTELGEAYYTAGQYSQSIHAFQETLILTPHAYNIFSRIGEVYHTQVSRNTSISTVDKVEFLSQAVKHFLRSVELCPVYIRGWAGVHITTKEILALPEASSKLTQSQKDLYNQWSERSERKLTYIISAKKGTPENLAALDSILKEF